MSQTQQPNQPSGKPPLVRLSTWVNVVLVLILFASCGGGDTADEVVNRLQNDTINGGTGGMATSSDVEDLCRLMGALAAKQGVPLTVMNAQEMTRCHEVAREAATAGTP